MTLGLNPFAAILTSIGWPSRNPNDPIEIVGFTSFAPGHGVSTISAQVAAAIASECNARTLLIDCNFKNPTLHQTFRQKQSPGMADILTAPEKLDETIQETSVTNLCLLSAGSSETHTSRLDEAIGTVLRSVLADCELAICDIPAIGSQPNTLSMLSMMDRVVVVVDSQKASSRQLEDCRKLMRKRGIEISGVVLNRISKKYQRRSI